MAIKANREYRNTGVLESREDNGYIVEGYASTFEPYLLFKEGGIEFYEKIDERAFDNTDLFLI